MDERRPPIPPPEDSTETEDQGEETPETPRETSSAAAQENLREERSRRQPESNLELVLDWLVEGGELTKDSELYNSFKTALVEQTGEFFDGGEKLDQTLDLLNSLPQMLESMDRAIDQLDGKENYQDVREKRKEIIKGLCCPVINGHLDASDLRCMLQNVVVISKRNPPAERKDQIDKMIAESGYDGVLFCDPHNKEIVIFEETLVDSYPGFDKLDFKHMMTHEIAHMVAERGINNNESLIAKSAEIIEKATQYKDIMSQHVNNQLDSVLSADADFARLFPQGSDAEKNNFVEARKAIAIKEILADYTALYLQSDGSIGGFIQKCLELSDGDAISNKLGIDRTELAKINSITDPAERKETIKLLQDKSPAFIELCQLYKALYAGIDNGVSELKGTLNEDEDEFEIEPEIFAESPQTFSSPPGKSAGKESKGLFAEIGAFMKAFAEEADIVKS